MTLQAGAQSGLHRGSDSASWAPPPTPVSTTLERQLLSHGWDGPHGWNIWI